MWIKLLSLVIQVEMVPLTLRVPKKKFSGTTNLTNHVVTFKSHMNLYNAIDAAKCRAFLATFKGVARSWYDSLPSQSIPSFKYFKKLFVGHLMKNKR